MTYFNPLYTLDKPIEGYSLKELKDTFKDIINLTERTDRQFVELTYSKVLKIDNILYDFRVNYDSYKCEVIAPKEQVRFTVFFKPVEPYIYTVTHFHYYP